MRMKPVDMMGSLYSKAGLCFGGFQTFDFSKATEPLEQRRLGVREEIIAEAHYLVWWLHKFPEIAFFLGIILYESLWVALLLFVLAFGVEIIRFYCFGASPFLSYACKIWNLIQIPAFVITAIILWSESKFLSVTLLVFLIIQGRFDLFASVVMLPIRSITARLILKRHGWPYHIMESLAIMFVINRWRLKLGLTELSFKQGHISLPSEPS